VFWFSYPLDDVDIQSAATVKMEIRDFAVEFGLGIQFIISKKDFKVH